MAAGGSPISLKLPGIERPQVVQAADVYRNPERYRGKRAIVIGSGFTGLEAAEFLASQGGEVSIFELDDEIAKRISGDGPIKNKSVLLESLTARGVKMYPATNTLEIWEKEVLAENVLTKEQAVYPADLVVQALGYRPNQSLLERFAGSAALGTAPALATSLVPPQRPMRPSGTCQHT